ncbi:MAG: DOPA 4,5-dioxygenase family protein [Cyanobacteria bacterium P01_F01_bin.150]
MTQITGFHAHVYFGPDTMEQANHLCQQAGQTFSDSPYLFKVGRMHQRPIGPHPCWSCQLSFDPELFGDVIPWLALNRQGLTVFIHTQTGDDLKDHTDHAIWMGSIEPLRLSVLS